MAAICRLSGQKLETISKSFKARFNFPLFVEQIVLFYRLGYALSIRDNYLSRFLELS
jgi:hypothetical protein